MGKSLVIRYSSLVIGKGQVTNAQCLLMHRLFLSPYLIEIIEEQTIIPEFEPFIQAHDSYCRVSRLGLELA